MEKPIWEGTNVSGQQSVEPHEDFLEVLVETFGDYNPRQHIDCSLQRDVEKRSSETISYKCQPKKFGLLYQISCKKYFTAKSTAIAKEGSAICQEDNVTPAVHAPNLHGLIICEVKVNKSEKDDRQMHNNNESALYAFVSH